MSRHPNPLKTRSSRARQQDESWTTFSVEIGVTEPVLQVPPSPSAPQSPWVGNERRVNDDGCVNAKEALKRIDAAVIRTVLGAVCHQVIPIARHVKKGPFSDAISLTSARCDYVTSTKDVLGLAVVVRPVRLSSRQPWLVDGQSGRYATVVPVEEPGHAFQWFGIVTDDRNVSVFTLIRTLDPTARWRKVEGHAVAKFRQTAF